MPLRVVNTVERNIDCNSGIQSPLAIAAGVSTVVLHNLARLNGEWVGRYIQNVGANPCYYAIGHDCDLTNFNGILSNGGTVDVNGYASGQQFDASNCGGAVHVYSAAGTYIAITLLRRNDLSQASGGIGQAFNYILRIPTLLSNLGGGNLGWVQVVTPPPAFWEIESSVDNVTWSHLASIAGTSLSSSGDAGNYNRVYAGDASHVRISEISNVILLT